MATVTCITCGEVGNFLRCPIEDEEREDGVFSHHRLRTDEFDSAGTARRGGTRKESLQKAHVPLDSSSAESERPLTTNANGPDAQTETET